MIVFTPVPKVPTLVPLMDRSSLNPESDSSIDCDLIVVSQHRLKSPFYPGEEKWIAGLNAFGKDNDHACLLLGINRQQWLLQNTSNYTQTSKNIKYQSVAVNGSLLFTRKGDMQDMSAKAFIGSAPWLVPLILPFQGAIQLTITLLKHAESWLHVKERRETTSQRHPAIQVF